MKKKIRNIVVDGITYTWMCKRGYYQVFLDRKPWIYKEDDGMITPAIIRWQIIDKLSEVK